MRLYDGYLFILFLWFRDEGNNSMLSASGGGR